MTEAKKWAGYTDPARGEVVTIGEAVEMAEHSDKLLKECARLTTANQRLEQRAEAARKVNAAARELLTVLHWTPPAHAAIAALGQSLHAYDQALQQQPGEER